MADMLKVYISLNFDCCDNAVVKIWLGLSTKTTWLELGIDHVLGLKAKIHLWVGIQQWSAEFTTSVFSLLDLDGLNSTQMFI